MKSHQSPLEQQGNYGVIRTLLISYGVAAYAFLPARPVMDGDSLLFGMTASAHRLVLVGLGAQLLLLVARVLIKRYLSEPAYSAQSLNIAELVGDGVTVLLFALGTLGGIIHVADIA
jgi:hypothetical protein